MGDLNWTKKTFKLNTVSAATVLQGFASSRVFGSNG